MSYCDVMGQPSDGKSMPEGNPETSMKSKKKKSKVPDMLWKYGINIKI